MVAHEKPWWWRIPLWIAIGIGGWLILSLLVIILLRWIDPPASAFMIQRWVAAHFEVMILAIIFISVIPVAVEFLRHHLGKQAAKAPKGRK